MAVPWWGRSGVAVEQGKERKDVSEGLNNVTLIGNLGADPELRTTQGGISWLRLRLATTERYLNKTSNTWDEKTEWHSCTIFGKRAEALARFLKKGSRIFVSGPLRTSEYEKDGIKRYATEVIARQVLFAGGDGQKRADPDGPDAPRAPRAPSDEAPPGAPPADGSPADDFGYDPQGGDDSIPF